MDGTKVTSDSRTLDDPKNENPGMVTSDSLAAESIQSGESFGANADSRGPNAQPSSSTTTNTTDTSNATRLAPARDAEARQAREEQSGANQLQGGSKIQAGSSDLGQGGSSGAGSSGTQSSELGNDMPKGKNVTEGGFDSGAPNASFNDDIGGKNDPGRAALSGLQESNVPFAGGAGPRQEQISNDGQFDALKETSA